MIDSNPLREQCAQRLLEAAALVPQLTAFVGLDGFVDVIIHVVDKRTNAESFTRMATIEQLAARLAAAAGKSTNLEVVPHVVKLGGNGPIMANALASFGIQVTYLGILGHPNLHPVFSEFAHRAEVYSIAEPGQTDALEFDDGKVMIGKHASLKEVTWPTIQERFGRERFAQKLGSASLVGFVNWTMLPYMSQVWESILDELCPQLTGPRRKMFFDLADPEKRNDDDIRHALDLIVRFQRHFDVILGLNEKEANEIGKVLGFSTPAKDPEALAQLASQIASTIPVHTLVVHPTQYALAVSNGKVSTVRGLYTPKPKITTGAGDHFNAGFCLGKLLDFDDELALLVGVTNSGHYVRTGQSPAVKELVHQLRTWPSEL
jgi:fructose-1-phosphate kinase PfkB-like protein